MTAANSASGLATFMLAKRREGVLSHFPPHVRSHFKKDLTSSSYGGPHVFDDEVLARVIAASREDSNLDAQLSIAKAFTLPVFRVDAKKPGRNLESLLRSGFFCVFLGFSWKGQGLGFRRVEAQGFFSGSLPQGEVFSSSLFPCFQAGKRSQVKPGTLPSGDRRLSVPPLVRMVGQRCGALGGGSLEGGVCDSLSHASSSVSDSDHPGFVLSPVHQRESFGGGDSGSSPQGSGGACTSDSRLLQPHVCCHQGSLGGGGGIIDLSTLNLNVDRTPFRMETSQTVLCSVRRNDWMITIDLKDAYLQIPTHPESRRHLRFIAGGRT